LRKVPAAWARGCRETLCERSLTEIQPLRGSTLTLRGWDGLLVAVHVLAARVMSPRVSRDCFRNVPADSDRVLRIRVWDGSLVDVRPRAVWANAWTAWVVSLVIVHVLPAWVGNWTV